MIQIQALLSSPVLTGVVFPVEAALFVYGVVLFGFAASGVLPGVGTDGVLVDLCLSEYTHFDKDANLRANLLHAFLCYVKLSDTRR